MEVSSAGRQPQKPVGSPATTITQVRAQLITGPFPSADELAKYEQAHPGTAERLLQIHERQAILQEEQARHRFKLENGVISGDGTRATLGLYFGLFIAVFGLTAALIATLYHHEVFGTTIGIADLATLAGTFVYGSKSRRDERTDKLKPLIAERQEHDSAPDPPRNELTGR